MISANRELRESISEIQKDVKAQTTISARLEEHQKAVNGSVRRHELRLQVVEDELKACRREVYEVDKQLTGQIHAIDLSNKDALFNHHNKLNAKIHSNSLLLGILQNKVVWILTLLSLIYTACAQGII
jgi:septal ring factor EnvC (AmiA/AmiB activator)